MEPSDCAYCGRPIVAVNHSIHRDGFGVGPEVPLCDPCGSGELPSCEQIWDRIAQPSTSTFAHKRAGSKVFVETEES